MRDWTDDEIPVGAFYVDSWSVQIHQALAPIDILQALSESKDAAKFLKPQLQGVSHLSIPMQNFEMSEHYFTGELKTAINIQLSQMMVLAVTYGELIIKDFYRSVFYAYPHRMNSVLAPDGKGKATIDLSELLSTGSKDELLETLIERAARRIAARKLHKTIAQLKKESGVELKFDLCRDLEDLCGHRNRIVHEGHIEDTSLNQVHNAYGLLLYLLHFVCLVAEKEEIPIVDTVGFAEQFRKREEADTRIL